MAALAELLEVELELVVEGRLPQFPWVARASGPALQAQIVALLGAEPRTSSDVADAFCGLAMDTAAWSLQTRHAGHNRACARWKPSSTG